LSVRTGENIAAVDNVVIDLEKIHGYQIAHLQPVAVNNRLAGCECEMFIELNADAVGSHELGDVADAFSPIHCIAGAIGSDGIHEIGIQPEVGIMKTQPAKRPVI
jgi:hypothetical protein